MTAVAEPRFVPIRAGRVTLSDRRSRRTWSEDVGPFVIADRLVIAWYRENSDERIHEVGTKAPNPWGLYDLIGNAWEWCWDLYDPSVYGTYRVLRGGGWFDEHWSCRASVRRRSHPTLRIDDVGFRLARSVSPS